MLNADGAGPEGSDKSNEGAGEPEDDSDNDVNGEGGGRFVPSPTVEDAKSAYTDIKEILKPKRNKGPGHKDPKLDLLLRSRLEKMKLFLWAYINTTGRGAWVAASLKTAKDVSEGPWSARMLRKWAHAYIIDRTDFPINLYGKWNASMFEDEGLAQEIHLYLQGIGKYVKAMDIVNFLDTPDMRERLDLKKQIHLSTAQRWMARMGYRWAHDPKGQFVDGHEREDVVTYRQGVFLPAWQAIIGKTRKWTKDNLEDMGASPRPNERKTVVWFHDESTFYANDRRLSRWVHKAEKAVPYAKGEGASEMVADMVSADYGWLCSPDGKEQARVLFKAGKAREGNFTNDDILKQVTKAMAILDEHYPDEDHVFVFDNATTHLKRADNALSARKMPKRISKEGSNWGVVVNQIGPDGKPIYGQDGKIIKTKVQMGDGQLPDGSPQPLYFPALHSRAGVFKGMAVILEERGLVEESKLNAECKDFKCKAGATNCCCRRVLYSQPDFVNAESLLETHCKSQGYSVIFLPKFHCELNFIEQCWGYAKRIYRHFPPSSKEANLEANLLASLEAVPIESMRRYCPFFYFYSCLFIHLTALQPDHKGLWMPTIEAWMAGRRHGLQRSIEDTEYFQRALWRT